MSSPRPISASKLDRSLLAAIEASGAAQNRFLDELVSVDNNVERETIIPYSLVNTPNQEIENSSRALKTKIELPDIQQLTEENKQTISFDTCINHDYS